MDDYSQETLRKIEQNDLIQLGICNDDNVISKNYGRFFTSTNGGDYSRLGSSIGRNTDLKTLYVSIDSIRLSIADSGFFEGIKQNSSIEEFKLNGHSFTGAYNPIGEVGCALLKAFQENNSNLLTDLSIWCCDISSIDERVMINNTLSSCTNLKTLNFNYNNMTGEELLPMVEAVRGHRSLEVLNIWSNRFGNVGCTSIATLLADSNCNVHTLSLGDNQIGNEGVNTLANSLTNNNKLKELDIGGNQLDKVSFEDAFVRVLCNTSSINDIYSSNHTLEMLSMISSVDEEESIGIQLASLLKMNKGINKNNVAIKKILQNYPNIEMEPLFEWGSGNERNLMALPYVIDWFVRAGEVVERDDESVDSSDYSDSDDTSDSNNSDDYDYQVEEKQLTVIYEFALAMPLLFIPTSDKKRKMVS